MIVGAPVRTGNLNPTCRILFVGVFDFSHAVDTNPLFSPSSWASTNTSQLLALRELGYDVTAYNYRYVAQVDGSQARDVDLVNLATQRRFDLILYSKCNGVSEDTFRRLGSLSCTCLWFMDPLRAYNAEMKNKTTLVDLICCDKENVLKEARRINPNAFYACEGFNHYLDKPHKIKKEYDVSFIGNIYGNRQNILRQLEQPVKIVSNAYGPQHALEVSKSKINLNFCTSRGASDRVYKVLAAQGFLLTDKWEGEMNNLEGLRDLVFYSGTADLNAKINFYLSDARSREQIATQGYKAVQKLTRVNWARKILECARAACPKLSSTQV